MNNLLRTLTQSSHKPTLPESELRLLLTAVKDTRRSQGEKLAEEFHDALENLLLDLRTVTPDNHDAEPFLNRVSKTEAPDYYDIIQHPMDLGTMLRRVKGKHYRSKKEFKDDLDLVWQNCFTYNHAENHPIRAKANRLMAKSETLLAAITDKRERTDPYIPQSLSGLVASSLPHTPNTLPNGTLPHINGKASPFKPKMPTTLSRKTTTSSLSKVVVSASPMNEIVPFPDTHALLRTPEGMAAWLALDAEFSSALPGAEPIAGPGPSSLANIEERLRAYLPPLQFEDDLEDDHSTPDEDLRIGEKRKLNGFDHRPRKRSRLRDGQLGKDADPVELWWAASSSQALLANAVPSIPCASGSVPGFSSGKKKTKRREVPPNPKSLLSLMSDNIKTVKRVRRAHAKLSVLASSADDANPDGTDDQPSGPRSGGPTTMLSGQALEAEDADAVDDRPWLPHGVSPHSRRTRHVNQVEGEDCLRWMSGRVIEHAGFQGTSKLVLDVLGNVVGEYLQNVGRTMRFMVDKYSRTMTPEEMILHTLFESGITKVQDLENYVQEDIVHFGSRMGEIEKKLTTAYSDAAAALAGEGIVDDDQLFAEGDEDEGAFVMGGFAEAFGEDFLGLKALGIADEFGLSSLSIPRKLLRMRKARLDAERAKADQLDEILPYPLPPPLLPLRGDQIGHQIGLLRPFLENKFKALAVQQAAPPPPPSPSAAPPPPLLGPPALTGPSLLAPPALTGPPSLKPPTLTGPSSLSGPIINGLPPAPATAAPPISPLATPSSATTPSLPTMSSAVLEPQPMPPPPPLEVDPASLVMTDELPLASRCKLGSLGQVVKPGHAGGGSKKKGGSKASGAGAGAGGDGSAGSGNKGGSGAGKDGGGSKKKDKDKEGGGGGGGSKSKKAKVKMEGDGDGTSWDGRGSVAPSESPSSPKKIGRPPGRPPLAEGQKKKKPSKKKGAAAGGGEVQLPSMVAASA